MDPIVEKIIFTAIGVVVPALLTWLGAQIIKYRTLAKKEEDSVIKNTITNTLTDSLKPLQEDIGNMKTDISNMKTDIGNMKTDISNLKTDVSNLKTDVGNLKTDITNMKTDITNMKKDISKLQHFETHFSTRLEPTQDEIEHLKDDITEILDTLKSQGVDLQNIQEKEAILEKETRCAWRYRIRQLCHIYIARGYMSYEEYSQLQEMFNIYTAIGGNGQTKELYEKTIDLDIKTDAEIAALQALNRGKSCPMIHEDK